ncbi:uncharacterized protein [Lolium perenne]|uniref:uncharacterized protein n=1 Tax=Lolium perenne TaxID=4522 RepID=UPI003A99CEF8
MDARSSSSPSLLRIVISMWLAFGHLLPYLELAERLASRGHRVSTPRNIAHLPPLRPAAPLLTTSPTKCGSSTLRPSTASPRPSPSSCLPGRRVRRRGHEASLDRCRPLPPLGPRPQGSVQVQSTKAGQFIPQILKISSMDGQVPFAVLLPTAAFLATVPRPPLEHADSAVASVFEQAAARAVPRYEREETVTFLTGHGASSGMSNLQRCLLTQERCALTAMPSRNCLQVE